MHNEKNRHYQELLTLKTIAETLNQSNNMDEMLQTTLERLLELTNLETGWIFLTEEEPDYDHVADHNLPPALTRKNKEPMTCDVCLCLALYWEGGLTEAVNIIQCERLYNAVTYSWGDTHNLTHHATVPLTIRGERLGLLNVGSPGKENFSQEELTFLESVAYQIGTAIERTRLYEEKEKQAVDKIAQYIVDYYASANNVIRHIWKINDMDKLLLAAVERVAKCFEWPGAAIFMIQAGELRLKSFYRKGESLQANMAVPCPDHNIITRAYEHQTYYTDVSDEKDPVIPELGSYLYTAAIPLKMSDMPLNNEPMGVLFIGRDTEVFQGLEMEILEVLAGHISLAMEKILLYEEWQGLLLAEERNRLARDLHDSVNQKLFSLSLMAQGLKEMTKQSGRKEETDAAHEIGELAQESLSEMRSLLWQMRSQGEVKGILGALQEYAEKIGIHLTIDMKKTVPIPEEIAESFWRIGQEALNNVKKHAGTSRAWIRIEKDNNELRMKISDQGRGFLPDQTENRQKSIGLTSMRERAAEMNGYLTISSEESIGTLITVTVPFFSGTEGDNQ